MKHNGLINNFESLITLNSWENEEIAKSIKKRFDDMWNKKSKKLNFYSFPEALKKRLLQYHKSSITLPSDKSAFESYDDNEVLPPVDLEEKEENPECVDYLYEYQKDAIKSWLSKENRAHGIFNMATGSGKTLTAYGAICKLLEKKNYRLPIIIICPYRHLVDQWLEDVDKFKLKHVVCGYSGGHSGYKSKLKSMIYDFNDSILDYFVFITTTGSFRTDSVQEIINLISEPILLVADEAHNMGAAKMIKYLDDKYKYRLALSATIDRHGDVEGTKFLHDYFGNECITFTLSDAIKAGALCNYNYYPILTYLDSDELIEYVNLTTELGKHIYEDKNGKLKFKGPGKIIALKRARLIASTHGKIDALKDILAKKDDINHTLIYCGTANVENDDGVEVRQIDDLCIYLGKVLKYKIGRYTSRETPQQRIELKSVLVRR